MKEKSAKAVGKFPVDSFFTCFVLWHFHNVNIRFMGTLLCNFVKTALCSFKGQYFILDHLGKPILEF